MTNITDEDRLAMSRLRDIMEGKTPSTIIHTGSEKSSNEVELAGPGQTTKKDIDAMAAVLKKLNSVSSNVVNNMMTEGVNDQNIAQALYTERVPDGVQIGRYKIAINEDSRRLAGKQFYGIYNKLTGDTIAADISLYETAIQVVNLLNSGKFANSVEVRKLFENDDNYTSHRVDALMFKRRASNTYDISKKDIYESRYQASLDKAMAAKRVIKESRNGH